jgi:hypothetical protein
MKKSDVFNAIIKIKEHCHRQLYCEGCELCYIDEYDDCMCLLNGEPKDWNTDDIPYNILEEVE